MRSLNPDAAVVSDAVALGTVSPPPGLRRHLPALDGMRGLAVLIFRFVGQMLPTESSAPVRDHEQLRRLDP